MQELIKKEPPKELTMEDTITSLRNLPKQPIRLGIQGYPGEGKTWAALTFPNPIVLNLDNKLGGFQAVNPESNLSVVNFDEDLVLNKLKISNTGFGKKNDPNFMLNLKDAVQVWINRFGKLLTVEQTLFLDSWTTLQNRFDIQMQLPHEISITKGGAEDKYYFWRMKLKYSGEIMDALKTLKCNVVITFHETVERDEDGNTTGKMKPLMSGQFADQIAGQMTDFYRQRCMTRDMKNYDKFKEKLGRDIEGSREYFWQCKSTADFTACCSIPNMPDYVPAKFESLTKVYTPKV